MKVLLVDDEKEFVSTLTERLAMRGIEADYVSSPMDAIGMAEKKKYDIAVLDVKMPKIGGIKLKHMLQEKHPDMKFIFLTGHGSEDDFKTGSADTGSDYYLGKPISIDTLITKMNTILGR